MKGSGYGYIRTRFTLNGEDSPSDSGGRYGITRNRTPPDCLIRQENWFPGEVILQDVSLCNGTYDTR